MATLSEEQNPANPHPSPKPLNTTGWTAQSVRNQFISFFEDKQHTEWKSSSVVPHNDPTLLFINAGMNQFKPLFLRQTVDKSPMSLLKRAVNSQKCIRAGGKHNDLDDVGKDVYHHTFFEMLGSWSFGDYFKEKAIDYAWELLVGVFKLNPDRIYATYFGGDPKQPDCPPDSQSFQFWQKYLPTERILPFSMKDNFWEMGDTGPCGPCSEIHYDRIGDRDASSLVNADDPDVIEIWNLVFMQFNRNETGNLTPLPAPCVDTGMGFERLLSVLQSVNSNYDTDLFQPIFKNIHEILPIKQTYNGKLGEEDSEKVDTSYRVIADHIRCLTVAIADGASPSNIGRGYVLRRILRRALRYGYQFLNAPSDQPWLYKLVDSVISTIGYYFTEINEHQKKIKNIIKEEEITFATTLTKGMEHFYKIKKKIENTTKNNEFPANAAFTLQSSFGFPLELTQLMIEDSNLFLNMDLYNQLQEEHKLISQTMKTAETTFRNFGVNEEHHLRNELQILQTNDIYKYEFDTSNTHTPKSLSAQVVAIYVDEFVDTVPHNLCALILDKTCFYSEQGGQTFDIGTISTSSGMFSVEKVKNFAGYILHIGYLIDGNIDLGDQVEVNIDWDTRKHIAINHTATHALSFALRKITGSQCKQRGSLVDKNRLRFDFEFDSDEQADKYMADIQKHVNKMIEDDLVVYTEEVELNIAYKIDGVRAVFGENYPNPVRVVCIGKEVSEVLKCAPENNIGYIYSIEFCGGTHIKSLKEIKDFVIVDHSSIARGVRRIEGVTGEFAEKIRENDSECVSYINYMEGLPIGDLKQYNSVDDISSLSGLKMSHITHSDLNERLNQLNKKHITHHKNINNLIEDQITTHTQQLLTQLQNNTYIVKDLSDICTNTKLLQKALSVFEGSDKCAYFISVGKQSMNVVCGVSSQYIHENSNIGAVDWVNFSLQNVGKGGGNKQKAYGGAKITSVQQIIDFANQYAKQHFC